MINFDKSKVINVGKRVAKPVGFGEHNVEFMNTFDSIARTICYDGDASSNIRERLSKTR